MYRYSDAVLPATQPLILKLYSFFCLEFISMIDVVRNDLENIILFISFSILIKFQLW